MDDFERLGNSHLTLCLGKTDQPAQDALNLGFSWQLLREFLCTNDESLHIKETSLYLFYLVFDTKGNYREQLNHALHAYLRHGRSQGNITIDGNAFSENSEAFKRLDKHILARIDATGYLASKGHEEMLLGNIMRSLRIVT